MNVKSERIKPPSNADQSSTEKMRGMSLFDHIRHIQKIQDPNYFDKLTSLDRKTFNHFMILRGLSMNPELLDIISVLYKYFDKIPSPQFYKLLISFIPADHSKAYYPWIKATKKHKYGTRLVELIRIKFEVSPKEAEDYISILSTTETGKKELFDICQGFGLTDKEVTNILSSSNDGGED